MDGPKEQERLLLWFAEFRKFGHTVLYDLQMGKLLRGKWIVSLMSRITAQS